MTIRRVIGAWIICAVPIVVFALPHYIIDFQGVYQYIATTLGGSERALWSRHAADGGNDRMFQLRYFLNGEGGGFMLGQYLTILAVVLAVGFVVLVRRAATDRKSFGKLMRAVALAFVAFIAYIIPAVNTVKNPFFGSEFQILLLLGGILAVHMLLVRENRNHSSGFGAVLLLAMTAIGLAVWRFPTPMDSETTLNTNRVVHGVEQIILGNASADANIFLTSAGRLNSSTLYYLLQQQGKPATATDAMLATDPNVYKQQYQSADVVVAAEPGVDEFENWLPSYTILDKTLQLLRESPDFHQIGSIPSQSGKRFFVFARQPVFGGWNSAVNLSQAEGPFPQQGLPIIRWGLYPGVSLQISTCASGAYRLVADGSAPAANQQIVVTLDGREVGHRTIAVPGVFERIEMPLDLSTGEHEIVLAFSAYKPPDASDNRKLGLLFKRLQIVPAPIAAAATH